MECVHAAAPGSHLALFFLRCFLKSERLFMKSRSELIKPPPRLLPFPGLACGAGH